MCVYIRIDPELSGRPRGASRTNPGMLVLVSPSRPPQLWPSSGTRWLIHVTHQLLCRAAGGETHSAAEQCFHQKRMGRATDMPGCFQALRKKRRAMNLQGCFYEGTETASRHGIVHCGKTKTCQHTAFTGNSGAARAEQDSQESSAFRSKTMLHGSWPRPECSCNLLIHHFLGGGGGGSGKKSRSFRAGGHLYSKVIAQYSSAMAAGLSRQREWPTNAQLFLIGNSAPMADLHSGACTSLNPWPCQTQPWGKVEGMREKNKREERLESRGVKETMCKRMRKIKIGRKGEGEKTDVFTFCFVFIL